MYKNSGKIRYIFLSDSGCNSGGIYSFGAGFVRQQQIYKKVQENEQNSIRDFKNLIKELEICRLDISEENKKYIDKLYEKMRYSNPVSSPEVSQENEKIHKLIAELPGITESSQFEAKCLEIEKQLDIRKIKNTKEQG